MSLKFTAATSPFTASSRRRPDGRTGLCRRDSSLAFTISSTLHPILHDRPSLHGRTLEVLHFKIGRPAHRLVFESGSKIFGKSPSGWA